ncbi:MAG: MFS transporter [Clostridia bacterium]|nr:MFS transporter [Clostridia bacterium]
MKKEKSEIKKNIILLALIQFLSQIDFYSAIAILYFTEVTGSFMLGMSVYSITTLATAIFELPTGILSDKIGRKKTIILGSTFSIAASIVLLLSNNYLGLVLYSITRGLEKALFSGNNDAYLYDKLKESKEEHRFIDFVSKVKSMTYLAGAISALIGGIFLFFKSYKFVIAISIIPKIIQWLVSFGLDEAYSKKAKENNAINSVVNPLKAVMKNKLLLKKICADSIMHSITESCFQFRSTFYELVWPTWAVGLPRVLSNVGAFLSDWFGEKIIKKIEKKKVVIYSVIYSIFSNVLAVVMNNVISPIVMVSNSLLQTDYIEAEMEQKLYRDEYRASMGSIKALFESIMFSILSIILGLVADKFSVITSFVVFQLMRVIPLLIIKNVMEKIDEIDKVKKLKEPLRKN